MVTTGGFVLVGVMLEILKSQMEVAFVGVGSWLCSKGSREGEIKHI